MTEEIKAARLALSDFYQLTRTAQATADVHEVYKKHQESIAKVFDAYERVLDAYETLMDERSNSRVISLEASQPSPL